MIKKKYEIIEDGITYLSWDKNAEGLDSAYQEVEQIMNDRAEELSELSIICTHYNALGGIDYCELVDEWTAEDGTLTAIDATTS